MSPDILTTGADVSYPQRLQKASAGVHKAVSSGRLDLAKDRRPGLRITVRASRTRLAKDETT